jgi:hypothetical protein
MLGLTYLMLDCWLEVSLHPQDPVTDQLDQGFLWFSLVKEQMLNGTQIPRCTACFTSSSPNGNITNFALMYPF